MQRDIHHIINRIVLWKLQFLYRLWKKHNRHANARYWSNDELKQLCTDRIDDYKSYTLDNIQLITFRENVLKAHEDQITGKNRKLNKAAINTARKIGHINSKAARWVASDAIRELNSVAVKKRLKK